MAGETIKGQPAGSINEYNVYVALLRTGHQEEDIFYQYPLDGGRQVRGGQVIDFVLFEPPQPAAIYVQGKYWHGGKRGLDDEIKQRRAEQQGFYVVEILESECETIESAIGTVRKKVG